MNHIIQINMKTFYFEVNFIISYFFYRTYIITLFYMNLHKVLQAIDRSNAKSNAIKKQYSARFLTGHFSAVNKQDMKDQKRIFGHTLQQDIQFCKQTLKTSFSWQKNSSFIEEKNYLSSHQETLHKNKDKKQQTHKRRPNTSNTSKRKILTQQQEKQIWQKFFKTQPEQQNNKIQFPTQSQFFLTCHPTQTLKQQQNSKQNKQNKALVRKYRQNFTTTFDSCLQNVNFLRSQTKNQCLKIIYNCNRYQQGAKIHKISKSKIERKFIATKNSLIRKQLLGNAKYFVEDFKLMKQICGLFNKISSKTKTQPSCPIWLDSKATNNVKLVIIDTHNLTTILLQNCSIQNGIAKNQEYKIDIVKALSENFCPNKLYCTLVLQQNSLFELRQQSYMISLQDKNEDVETLISIQILKFCLKMFLLNDKNVKKLKQITDLIEKILNQNSIQSLQDCTQSLSQLPNKKIAIHSENNKIFQKSLHQWLAIAIYTLFTDLKRIKQYPKIHLFLSRFRKIRKLM